MKKILFIMTAMLVLGSTGADAQGFLNKLKEKAKEKISKKIEGTVEEKAKEVVMQDAEEAEEAPAEEAKPVIPQAKGEAVKSDFVPGSVVIFEDNLQGEKMGEFPSKWDLIENNAEVAKMNGKMAIKFEHGSNTSITPLIKDGNKKYLPEVYTLEFDFFVSATEAHSAYILHQETEQDWVSEIFFNHDNINWRVIKPNGDQTDGNAPTESFIKQNSWNHFALSFNKRALKVYINNHRVMNIPNAKAPSWFYIRTEFWEDHVDYITNVRLAKGGVELYQQNAQTMTAIEKAIAETGKFVTNNILFDTGKATLKQESMAEIQKVADYMKKNPKARFEVQGHTDNQGSDKVNDPLSQQRAEAIVAALVKMGYDEFNLKAVGKGSHEPVADNKTAEGRAKNRRVEFIKK
jgi:outer membrane protein OmpA-like peptidoglycan-associated protein